MKKRTRNKLLAIVTAILLAAVMVVPGIGALKTNAAGKKYTAVTLAQAIPLKKVLDMPIDTKVPSCGFIFTIEAGTAIPADTGKFAVLPGLFTDDGAYPQIAKVAFTANEDKDSPAVAGTTSSCTKPTAIDFTGVEFSEPGVYRYVITEDTDAPTYSNVGVGNDEYIYRILDIYVEDNNGSLAIAKTIMTKSTTKTPEAPEHDGDYTAIKSDSFINKYPTNTLSISKTVTGNQGSKDEYFKFTIKLDETSTVTIDDALLFPITGLDNNNQGSVNTITENSASKNKGYTVDIIDAANKVASISGADLKAGYDVYLQHSDTVTLSGLVPGCKFTITEENGDYAVSTEIKKPKDDGSGDETVADEDTQNDEIVKGTMDKTTKVAFTNDKDGIIPTGVILSVAPWAIAGVVILAGVVFFAIRSRKKYEEE